MPTLPVSAFSRKSPVELLQRLYQREEAAARWLWQQHESPVCQQLKFKTAPHLRDLVPGEDCFLEAFAEFLETLY